MSLLVKSVKYRNYLQQLNNLTDDFNKHACGEHYLEGLSRKGHVDLTCCRNNLNELLACIHMSSGRAYHYLNYYMTLNTVRYAVHHARRRKVDVEGLCAIWADIDLHDIHMTKADFLPLLTQILKVSELPMPTAIDDSGHGYHLIWLFTHEQVVHSKKIVRRWNVLEHSFNNRLNEAYFSFVPKKNKSDTLTDPRVEEISRVLRVPNTWNVKSKPEWCHTVNYTGASYDMIGLCNEYIRAKDIRDVCGHSHKHLKKTARSLKRRQRYELYKSSNHVTVHIDTARLRDFVRLVPLRNSEKIYTGYREELIWLYMVFEVQLGQFSRNHHNSDLWKLNGRFAEPLGEQELNHVVHEAENGYINSYLAKYNGHITNSYIIDALGITPDEQKSLKFLVASGEQRHRHNLKRNLKNRRRSHKCGAKHEREKRIQRVVGLSKRGLSIRKIAKKTGINKKTVNKYLK